MTANGFDVGGIQRPVTQIVKALLEGGANPNQANKPHGGWTALIAVARRVKDIPKPSRLCSTTAQIRIRQTKAALRALMSAAIFGHSDVAKILLDTNGVDPNQANKNGLTALMSAADLNPGHSELTRQSFARQRRNAGSGRQKRHNSFGTGAFLDGVPEAVKVLLDNGANPKCKQTKTAGRL